MKRLLPLALTLTAALSAFGANSALTPDGSRYSVEASPDAPQLLLVRVAGDTRDTIAVPTTDDEAIEAESHVAYDAITGSLYVIWTRHIDGADELRYAVRNADGGWSQPITVTSSAERILGSQVVVTHRAEDDVNVSFIHLAWWKVGAGVSEPWYALVALEKDQQPVTSFANLVELAALSADAVAATDLEETGAAVHPPLTMSRNGQEVDIVFGAVHQTAVTSVTVKPRKIDPTARIFVPVGRRAFKTPRANFSSSSEQALEAFISRNGRIVLYSRGEHFSYVVLDNNEWTPARTLKVDEKMTLDHVLKDLRNTVEELETLSLPQTDR
ncbi:MAG TPA: hypothetical protein VGD79_12145 [Thermoanaerobaculia bacterium]|jgi:hypothetical protein